MCTVYDSNCRSFLDRPRSELTDAERAMLEEYEFNHGPLSVLQNAVQNHSLILISCRNNKKYMGRIKAFDRHSNMVLENVKEVSFRCLCLFLRFNPHTPRLRFGTLSSRIVTAS